MLKWLASPRYSPISVFGIFIFASLANNYGWTPLQWRTWAMLAVLTVVVSAFEILFEVPKP